MTHAITTPIDGPLAALVLHLRKAEKQWDNKNCELADTQYTQILRPIQKKIVGVQAVTAADALAAIDYLISEKLIEECGPDYGRMVNSLVDAIRGYIVATGKA